MPTASSWRWTGERWRGRRSSRHAAAAALALADVALLLLLQPPLVGCDQVHGSLPRRLDEEPEPEPEPPEPEPEPEPLGFFDMDDNSFVGIAVTLGINVVVFGTALLFTSLTRSRGASCKCAREDDDGRTRMAMARAEGIGAWRTAFFEAGGWMDWPGRLWSLPDEDVRQLVGERAVCYLRFQKVLLWVVSLYFAVGMSILVPINMTGRVCDFVDCPPEIESRTRDAGDRLLFMSSSENVATADRARLATYFAVTVLFTVFSFKALGQAALLRQTTLVPPGELPPPRAQYYSLMARRVPRYVTSSAAARTLQQGAVVLDGDGWPDSEAAAAAGRKNENAMIACTVTDGTAFMVFATNRAAAEFLESHRAQFGRHAICGRLWDFICSCTDRAVQTTSGTVVKTTSGLLAPPRQLFVFDSTAVRAIGLDRWKVQWAPPPDDVLWDQLRLDTCNRYTRWTLLSSITLIATLLLVFPLTVAGQVYRVAEVVFDAADINTSSLIFTLFSKYLPTMLALIVNAGIIPTMIELQSEFEGHFRRSDASSGCLRKQLFFLFAAVVIIPALSIGAIDNFIEVILKYITPGDILETVAREALTSSAPYFLRYLLQAGLLATAVAMLLWQKRLIFLFTCGKVTWEYPFEYHYAMCCCLFTVTLFQGTFYPALLPFGLLFLVLKHFVDKFVLLFGHGAEQISSSGQALRDVRDVMHSATHTQRALLSDHFPSGLVSPLALSPHSFRAR
jgi:hypothetical protein